VGVFRDFLPSPQVFKSFSKPTLGFSLAQMPNKGVVDLRDSAASRSGAPISASARRNLLKAVLMNLSVLDDCPRL
jgi:hypothetical protein